MTFFCLDLPLIYAKQFALTSAPLTVASTHLQHCSNGQVGAYKERSEGKPIRWCDYDIGPIRRRVYYELTRLKRDCNPGRQMWHEVYITERQHSSMITIWMLYRWLCTHTDSSMAQGHRVYFSLWLDKQEKCLNVWHDRWHSCQDALTPIT